MKMMKVTAFHSHKSDVDRLRTKPKINRTNHVEDVLLHDSSKIGINTEDEEPVTINFLYGNKLTSLKFDKDGKTQVKSVQAPGPKPISNDPPMKLSVLRNGQWVDLKRKRITGKNIAVMVHGFMGNSGDLLGMANYIQKEHKFNEIIAVDYDKGYKIDDMGKKLSEVLSSKIPGNSKLTLITHSMGGLVSRSAMEKHGLADRVDKLITLGTPHKGVKPAIFFSDVPGSTPEIYDMSTGSEFLQSLNDSKPLDTKYYSTIGTEGKYLTKYWTVKYLGESIVDKILGDKDNDGLVASNSSGYDLANECVAWKYEKFPVNHAYLRGEADKENPVFEDAYKQVDAWLGQRKTKKSKDRRNY